MRKRSDLKIEILRSGCPKCRALAEYVETTVRELGLEADTAKVTDGIEIAERGAMLTPTLRIDGDIGAEGKLPDVVEVKRLLVR